MLVPGPNGVLFPCGVGCRLARTFALFGLRDDGSCGCAEYAAQMDAWGPAECWRRLEEIVEHLREVAKKRGLPFIATAARIAVSRAIDAAQADIDRAATVAAQPPGEPTDGKASEA